MTNREFFVQHWKLEFPRFMGVLEAAPGGQLDYRPHPKSRSAREIIEHLIGHVQDIEELATTGKINHRMQVPFKSLEEALALYRSSQTAAEQKLDALDDGKWESLGQFLVSGNLIYEHPRRDLAWLLLFDAVHHRGQLSTYLRPMGATVPSIYGPSADTMPAAT